MAVQPQTPYQEDIANGVTTVFPLGFDCENKDHLIVLIDDLETDSLTWSLANKQVTFTAPPELNKKITFQRNTPFKRERNYQSYDNSFRPDPVNKDFDWLWFKLQELGVADWILGNRIDALKNYVDRKDDELKAYLMEEIRKQGVALDQLDEYYNYLMQQLAQIAVNKGWLDSFVVTWSGRTQEQKNRDILDPRDFGAIAYTSMSYSKATNSNVVNSTSSFAAFESVVKDQAVDLQGQYYIVDIIPNGNKYYNGYFTVNGLNQKQELSNVRDIKWTRGCGEGFCFTELQARDVHRSAGYIQSTAYNPVDDTIWTLSNYLDEITRESFGVLQRYRLESKITPFADIVTIKSTKIGHQGLGIQYVSGALKLWVGAHETDSRSGTHIMRCTPPANGGDITNLEYFKVFDPSEGNLNTTYHLTPSVSPNQDLLCCANIDYTQQQYKVKIFDITKFVDQGVDYSDNYLHSFYLTHKHDGALMALQSVVTDGVLVYCLLGFNTIQVYTLDGKLVDVIDHAVGYNRSQNLIDANGTAITIKTYEPESLLFVPSNNGYTLGMSIAMGYLGSWTLETDVRRNYIYTSIPQFSVRNNPSHSATRPTVISNQPIDISVPFTKGFNLSCQGNAFAAGQYQTMLQVTPSTMHLNNEAASLATGRKVGLYTRWTTTADRVLCVISTSSGEAANGATISLYDNTDTVVGGNLVLSAGNVTGTPQALTIQPDGTISPTNGMVLGTSTRKFAKAFVIAVHYTPTVFDSYGVGSPEGVVVAGVGSTYRRTDGGANTTFYVKELGTGNTGWVLK